MKLALGTAQFGLAYGISGFGRRVEAEEVRAILELAKAHGVRMLDTAPAYGDSEAVLGACLGGVADFDIVTKTASIGGTDITPADLVRVEDSFSASLKRLRVQSVAGVLVHRAADLHGGGGDHLFAMLERWRAQGRTRKIGVSVYTRAEIDALFDRHSYDIVQVPVSVFDQRLVADGTLDHLKRSGVEVHARSVLLQGLALMEPDTIPQALEPARALVAQYRSAMADCESTPLAGALRFVAGLPAVDKILIGVHSASQVSECLMAIEGSAADCDYSMFACANETIIDPRQWSV